MKMSGNTIAITGGGSGIGRQLALRFSEFGNRIIVAGRRKESLEETIAGRPNMHALVLDVDDPESIESFVTRLVTEHPALNVLINNAGIMRQERLTGRWDLRDSEQTILTNLLGPIRLTNALVDHLAVQPDAAIVNVTSGLAFVPLPVTPTYSATKAALHSFTLSLREQLKGRVEVIELAEVAASERHPHHPVAVDVGAARAEARHRDVVDFGERRLGRVRARIESDDRARIADGRSPDGAVRRARHDGVKAGADALVARRVERLVRLDARSDRAAGRRPDPLRRHGR